MLAAASVTPTELAPSWSSCPRSRGRRRAPWEEPASAASRRVLSPAALARPRRAAALAGRARARPLSPRPRSCSPRPAEPRSLPRRPLSPRPLSCSPRPRPASLSSPRARPGRCTPSPRARPQAAGAGGRGLQAPVVRARVRAARPGHGQRAPASFLAANYPACYVFDEMSGRTCHKMRRPPLGAPGDPNEKADKSVR